MEAQKAIAGSSVEEASAMNNVISLFVFVARHLTVSALVTWGFVFFVAVRYPSLFVITLPLTGIAILLSGLAFMSRSRRR